MGPCQTKLFQPNEAVSVNEKITSEFASSLITEHSKPNITLDSIFPTEQEENKLQRARRILGEIVTDIPDDILEIHLVKFQYLVDCWLDSFEKQAFNGKTLDQLLREG
jgi:hypothetical protein